MRDKTEIIDLLTNGLNSKTIKCLSDQIISFTEQIINISNMLNSATDEQVQLLIKDMNKREEIAMIKTIDGDSVGLEFRFISIIKDIINGNLIISSNLTRKLNQ